MRGPRVIVPPHALTLRLPVELHDRLRALSRLHQRSLTSEIVYLLRQAAERNSSPGA